MVKQWHCPHCCTELHEIEDFYWCTECAQFWWLEQVEPGRIPGNTHWEIRNSERSKLIYWNARVDAWNKVK